MSQFPKFVFLRLCQKCILANLPLSSSLFEILVVYLSRNTLTIRVFKGFGGIFLSDDKKSKDN